MKEYFFEYFFEYSKKYSRVSSSFMGLKVREAGGGGSVVLSKGKALHKRQVMRNARGVSMLGEVGQKRGGGEA